MVDQVKDLDPRNQYTATSGQTIFPYTFPIFDKDDLVVIQEGTTLTEGTDYTVSGVGDEDGGDVTLTTGATTGDTITIYRDIALERLVDYQDSGDFLASDVNDDFDRQLFMIQQLNRDVQRALRVSQDDEIASTQIGDLNTRANKLLAFDANGELTYQASTTLSPAADSLVDTVAAAKALNLAIGDYVRTGGHTSFNDGGGALYRVVAGGTGTDDGIFYHDMSNGNQLELIIPAAWNTKAAGDSTAKDTKFTVGATGDFSTINAALATLSTLRPVFIAMDGSGNTNRIILELESGFTMSEQVFVYGKDLSFIEITSIDAEVTIDRSALTVQPNITNWVSGLYPAFSVARGGHLPIISCLFNMDATGTASGRTGIFVHESSRAVITRTNGVKNAGHRGLDVSNSVVYARETNFSGAGDAAYRVGNGSVVNLRDSNGSGSLRGLYCTAAYAVANDCDFSGCSEYAIYATGAAVVHAPDTASGTADLSGAGIHGVFAEDGSKINVTSADISGATSDAINARSGSNVIAIGANLGTPGSESISVQTRAEVVANGATGVEAIGCFTGGKVEITNATTSGSPTFSVTDGSEIIANGTSGASYSQIANVTTEDGVIYADSTDNDAITISSGAITITAANRHRVDTESAAATDDLDTINGGYEGQVLSLSQVSNVRDVTYKHGTGNLELAGGADFVGTTSASTIILRLIGSTWYELARYN